MLGEGGQKKRKQLIVFSCVDCIVCIVCVFYWILIFKIDAMYAQLLEEMALPSNKRQELMKNQDADR